MATVQAERREAAEPPTKHTIVAPPAWIQSYVSILSRRGWLAVALFWLCVTVAGAAGAARTFGNLKLQIEAIPGDANDLAAQALRAHFPEVWRRQLTLVELRASDGTTAVTSSAPVRAAADRLGRFAAPYVASGLISSDSAASFFNLSQAGLAPFAAPLLSPSGTSVAVQFFTTEGYAVTDRYKEFLLALRDELRAAEAASGGAVVGRDTGPLAISFDSSTAITMDIGISDSITVTISFLILAFALGSLRLILLTFLCLVASFGGAFLLTWPLTTALSTPNFTTSLIISTLVSLSLDYSLFLLSYVKDLLARGVPMPVAVAAMLASPGHTVLVSGCTLASCFLVLAIFPVSIVRAPGIAATFAVVMSVASALSLVPALLLAFPRFFAPAPPAGVAPAEADPEAAAAGDAEAGPTAFDASAADSRECAAAAASVKRRCCLPAAQACGRPGRSAAAAASGAFWRRLAETTRRFPLLLTAVVLALLVAPFAYRLEGFRGGLSQSLRNIAPRGEESVETYYGVQERFSPGSLANARLIGVSRSGVGALSPQFFASAAAAVRSVLLASNPSQLQPGDVSGLAWSAGGPANASRVSAAVGAVSACPGQSAAACSAACSPDACLVRLTAAQTLSDDGLAMLLRLNIRMDRASPEGVEWANRARAALASANGADQSVAWSLLVDATPDSVAYIYDRFGELVGITAAVIFAILAAAFQSAAISLRSLVSLAAMEVCVFGATTAIFAGGALRDAPGVLHTFSTDTGLFWLMPLIAFSLTAGLGLDYDIFLMTAIVEERQAGFSDEEAVALGLQRSGPVITWAGLIMAVAYSGFLFSEIPLLNVLGFMICFAVLIDSFVVRPILVPSQMYLLGKLAWWPRGAPPVTRSLLGGSPPPAPPAPPASSAARDAERQA